MFKTKIIMAASTAAILTMATPAVASAATTDSVHDAKTSKWSDDTTRATAVSNTQYDGAIHIECDINDSGNHDAGTFIITIPTLIKHIGLKAGTVNITDTYALNVRGLIPGDKKVHLEEPKLTRTLPIQIILTSSKKLPNKARPTGHLAKLTGHSQLTALLC